MPNASAENVISTLRARFPAAAFLALGQTVLWDEPVKAAWLTQLNEYWPTAHLTAGVHDTDYFAKTTAHVRDDSRYMALSHDDGSTRGLWSAAGELSTLFGSEDLPTRAYYEKLGIPFDRLAAEDERSRTAFYADCTAAWGWRGIVQTTGAPLIAHDVSLSEYWPALKSTIEWGLGEALSCIAGDTRQRAGQTAGAIEAWFENFVLRAPADATLSDLYEASIPFFYSLLLRRPPHCLATTRSVDLLRFAVGTAALPRFAFLDCFLAPDMRASAVHAYNTAVAGGGMYPLSAFGDDALPFDVVVPGRGRGTLHLSDTQMQVDFTPAPSVIALDRPVRSRAQLADVLAQELGETVVVVGKAVALISMLAGEFVIVFHETASGYTDRTLAMNDAIRVAGTDLPLLPIVRIAYPTWDSLASAPDVLLQLPGHLSSAFGSGAAPVAGRDFASRWREVAEAQKAMIAALRSHRGLRGLIGFLETVDTDEDWFGAGQELESALYLLQSNSQSTAALRRSIADLRDRRASLKARRAELERSKGDDFRTRLQPAIERHRDAPDSPGSTIAAIEEDRDLRFTQEIARIGESVRQLRRAIKTTRQDLRAAERTDEALQARETIRAVTRQALLAKLKFARIACLVSEGLHHTNARPTAWWLPLVDPSGRWFDAMSDGLQARLERV